MSAPSSPSLSTLLERAPFETARAVGLTGAARGHVLSQLHRAQGWPLWCITVDEDEADALAQDLAFFLGGTGTQAEPHVLRLPTEDALPWDELIADSHVVSERLGTLFHLGQGTQVKAVVLSVRALLRKVMPPGVMNTLSEWVTVGQEHPRDGLAQKLLRMGYRSSPMVEDPGSYSMRGDIIDVFPPLHEHPVRLEFFGDFVESMRAFDLDTQRTLDSVKELFLVPARELFFSPTTQTEAEKSLRALAETSHIPTTKVRERIEQVREGLLTSGLEGLLPGFYAGGLSSVLDYLPSWSEQPLIYFDQPESIRRAAAELETDIARSYDEAVARGELCFGPDAHYVKANDAFAALASKRQLEAGGLTLDVPGSLPPVSFSFTETQSLREAIRSHHGEEGALSPLVDRLSKWRDEKIAVAIACGTLGQADRLKRLLNDRAVIVRTHTEPLSDPGKLYEPAIWAHLFAGEISKGFVDAAGGFALLTDEDIFGVRARRRTRRRRADNGTAASFKDLKEGDLVVHSDFGVARYQGLTKMPVQGIPGDFLVLQFAGKDKIYLPVSRMRLVSKFSGGDPGKIALDKLGTGTWERTRARVKENLLKMAAELLKLYAARRAHPGHAFSPPDRYLRQFEADFAFDETPDQQKAIDDVIADMQKPQPMDRLICGDVGYGKTEVAMRAAFKCVIDRKQVAILVPTTLLAHQHYQSFVKRFEGYPVTIEVVSSLRKPAEAREVLNKAREGRLDILIGTHKLLGNEVGFKDLGLLVVDEEQRFGVKQKEQIKRFKSQVDTLTLSATPIPRTLNMAMSGLRDMSLITTPPADRRSIRTFVNKFDPGQIKEAVLRELQRNGQVFFVHNRVSSIHSMEKFLKELLPNVNIGVAHGQMAEGALEKVMLDFVEKRLQVLLCTSIIESGIDISSANTMIVNRADAFGLSQLYQLRGRVGRSRERAYAYLLVPARRAVTKDAERRLEVLQAFSELGAGFTIASHDLEIRGAGNLLGGEQSGSIEAVGFDLYAQMLEEAVAEMQGEPPPSHIEPDVNLPVAALLPDDYVPDVHQRLVLYKRFSQAASNDELQDLRTELIDRYGEAPDEVDHLSQLMSLKMEMRELRLRSLDVGPGRMVLTLGTEAKLDGAKLAQLVQKSKGVYRLTPEMKLIGRIDEEVKGVEFIGLAKRVLRDVESCAVS
ncbi:MAG: transcription-repair coupling factor [Myxococcaceae bacterium]|nr:transcription-repair coupling factor [Myxococcaceae bacterium]